MSTDTSGIPRVASAAGDEPGQAAPAGAGGETAAAAGPRWLTVLRGAASRAGARRAREDDGTAEQAPKRATWGDRARRHLAGARDASHPYDYRPMSLRQLAAFIKGGSGRGGKERQPLLELVHDWYMRLVAIPSTAVLNCVQWVFQRPLRLSVAAVIVTFLYGA
jgi:hypothetical protein